jgi:hypothetical protein
MIRVAFKFFKVAITLVFILAETGKIFRNHLRRWVNMVMPVIVLYQL